MILSLPKKTCQGRIQDSKNGVLMGRFVLTLSAAALLSISMFSQSSSNPRNGLLLVANKGDSSLGIIDPVAGKQIAEVPEGGAIWVFAVK